MVAVGVFHHHRREEGRIFVRTVFRDHQRRKTQRYRTVQRNNDIMPVRILAEPNLFTLEQYRLLIIFIDFQQREQTALIVDIGQSRRITDKCAGNPAHSNPRQASQYRLGRNNSCGSRPAAGCLQKQSRFHPPKTSARVSDSPDGRQRSVEIRLLKSIVGRLKGFVFQTAFWFGWGSHQSILAVLDSNY